MKPREFTDRYNELTKVFMAKFGEGMEKDNIVFSPFSILSVLTLLADATAGTGRQEILNLLYGRVPQQGFPDQLSAAHRELIRKEIIFSGDGIIYLSCFYWDGEVKEKIKNISEGAYHWLEEHEAVNPDYFDTFRDPDSYIWEYLKHSEEPWVDWPSRDGFKRYQNAAIDVYKEADYPFRKPG